MIPIGELPNITRTATAVCTYKYFLYMFFSVFVFFLWFVSSEALMFGLEIVGLCELDAQTAKRGNFVF